MNTISFLDPFISIGINMKPPLNKRHSMNIIHKLLLATCFFRTVFLKGFSCCEFKDSI